MMSPLMWDVGRAMLRPFFQFVYRLKRTGADNIPATGPVLIVCNHLSMLDPPFVGGAARPRRVYFMSKAELFKVPPVGWVLAKVGAFPVERGGADRDAIRTAREILARGDAMVMFPEGTRSLSGNIRPFFPGAGLMALEPGVKVVPAALWGSQKRFGPVTVVFGEVITMDDIPEGARSERARLATDKIVHAIAALVEQAGGPPQVIPTGTPSLERY